MLIHVRRFPLILLPGLAAASIAACAVNPVSGSRELALLRMANTRRASPRPANS
jgi:hypothetical protein